jgi:hypothetical protein
LCLEIEERKAMKSHMFTLTALAMMLATSTSRGGEAPAYVSLDIYPPTVSLHSGDDYQGVVAVATRADGVTHDVTEQVEWNFSAAGIATLDESQTLRPAAKGSTQLHAKLGELTAQIDVAAANIDTDRQVSFANDVMPVFMRAGCNAGSCHGASRGKDGFRLSLFGFDPAGDHHNLTRELATRRINRAIPEDSLLLEKSIGAVPHGGGKRFAADTVYYQIIRDWIDAGTPNDVAEAAAAERLELFPPRAVLEGEGSKQRFVAVAHYADGTTRDVTNLVVFQSNNDVSAAIDDVGNVTAGARGESFVMSRFATFTVGSQVIVIPAGLEYTPPATPPANYIDEHVNAKLVKLRLEPSEQSHDAEFLRRVSIDIAGQLPDADEVRAFVADTAPDKRERKIDELLATKEFAEIWAMKLSELLLVRSENNRVDYKPMFLYSQWVTRKMESGTPLDQIVREVLGASGGSFDNPAVNFYQIEPDTLKTSENVAQAFMGIRTQCAQCHNHPFDRWTMDDYYSFAAFFSQIGRKNGEDFRETVVFNRNSGEVNHPVGNRQMTPKFLGDDAPEITSGDDRREVVAEWITSPENPYFATSMANRVWAHFFGVGIVEPVDDIRVSNPASNPELFATLGNKFVEYKYDLRRLVKDICMSNAYQRSTVANDSNIDDTRNFARSLPRRIPAEMLLDCICQVTGAPEKFPGLPLGARAVQIADGRTSTYFLTTFGRAERQSVCACETKAEPTLSQALHMLNGGTVHGKISQGKTIVKWLDEGKTPAEVIDLIYLNCLGREPTSAERDELVKTLGDAEKPVAELEDVFWAVLNSREFLFNH